MKIHIHQQALAKGVTIAQRAISNRTSMQILEGIYLETQNNSLIIKATDTEISIEYTCPCMVDEPGSIVVQASLFGEIVRKLPSGMVHMDVDGTKISLQCEKSSFELMGQDGEEYPMLPEIEVEEELKLPGEDLEMAFKQTLFAVSTDDMRIALTGVLMDISPEGISFVSLDGYRLAKRELESKGKENHSLILPSRSVSELTKLLGEEDVPLSIGHNHICFHFEDMKFYTKLLNGEFFQYENLLRTEHERVVQVDRKNLQASIERAALLVGKNRSGLIKLHIEEGKLSILSNSEIGNVHEEIACKTKGDELTIAFNAKYLLDGIRVSEGEELLLQFIDGVNPCIIQEVEDQSYLYLVLPVRLAGQ